MTDELEALFDKIADEQREKIDNSEEKPVEATSSGAEPPEDELEALFDEISTQTQTGQPVSVPPATKAAEPSEDELEALFDELSEKNQPGAEATAPETTETETAAPKASLEEAQAPAQTASGSDGQTQGAPSLENDMNRAEIDKPLYERIGSILRQLHDSMRELGYDRALQDVATEIFDAKGRLEYVANLTEQAATRVLNSIDAGMPQQEELAKSARELETRWTDLFDGKMDVTAFRQLAQDSREFAIGAASRADEEKARLMEIMMAQDFQDITGQVIKKVVIITKKLEQELAQLLRDNAPPESKDKIIDLMAGPDVPGKAMQQDDVDSLLANLGF